MVTTWSCRAIPTRACSGSGTTCAKSRAPSPGGTWSRRFIAACVPTCNATAPCWRRPAATTKPTFTRASSGRITSTTSGGRPRYCTACRWSMSAQARPSRKRSPPRCLRDCGDWLGGRSATAPTCAGFPAGWQPSIRTDRSLTRGGASSRLRSWNRCSRTTAPPGTGTASTSPARTPKESCEGSSRAASASRQMAASTSRSGTATRPCMPSGESITSAS